MRIWSPCPECGKAPWRPEHPVVDHNVAPGDVADLDALAEWAAEQRQGHPRSA